VRTVKSDPKITFNWGVLWAPDDESIFMTEAYDGFQSIVKTPLGGGAATRVVEGEPGFEYLASSITSDGKTLIYTKIPLTDKKGDIMTLCLEKNEPAKPFMQTPEREWSPLLSPAEDALAYLVGDEELYSDELLKVCSFPIPSTSVQVSAAPVGNECVWLGASELAWSDTSDRLWSATIVVKDGRIDVSPPKPMFDGKPLDKQTRILDYDIPRERFLIAVRDEPQEDPRLIIVSDWRQDSAEASPAQR
jgi:hypothetical protein